MIIGVPREIKDNEARVGVTPAGVKSLTEAGHKVLVDPDTTKKGVPTSYAIRNSENRYWRGPTRRSSEWTPAIALAYKFKAVNEAVAVATSVGAAAIVELRGNTVEEIRRIGK